MNTQDSRAIQVAKSRLPYHEKLLTKYNIDSEEWKALVESVWPAAQDPGVVVMAIAYCRARNLDPLKRVVHIVPIYDKERKRMVETVWPGIAELRTTAFRVKDRPYAGHDPATFGPLKTEQIGSAEVTFPEWCQLTVYRKIDGERVPFPGPTVYWLETYAMKGGKERDGTPNAMWLKRPRGQLEKCAEAAALRSAFPEEIGGELAAEEMHGQTLEGSYDQSTDTWAAEAMAARPGDGSFASEPLVDLYDMNGEHLGQFVEREWVERFHNIANETSLDGKRGLLEANHESMSVAFRMGLRDIPAAWNELSVYVSASENDVVGGAEIIDDEVRDADYPPIEEGGTFVDDVDEAPVEPKAEPKKDARAMPEALAKRAVEQIEADASGIKTSAKVDEYLTKKKQVLDELQAGHPALYQRAMDAINGAMRAAT